MKTPPYIIILSGATGSGKTSLLFEVVEHLGIKSYDKHIIDDLIENDPYYKSKIKELLEKRCQGKCDIEKVNIPKKYNIDKNLSHQITDTYMETKEQYGCKKQSCSKKLDNSIKKSIRKGENVILEITGMSYPKWLFNKDLDMTDTIIKNKYKVIIAYSLVSFCELIKRNYDRSYQDIKRFIESNYKSKAPRMPNISEGNQLGRIKNTIISIIKKECINKNNVSWCGNYKLDNLLLFNNNYKMKLVYDYKNDNNDNNDKKQLVDNIITLINKIEKETQPKIKKNKLTKKIKKTKKLINLQS